MSPGKQRSFRKTISLCHRWTALTTGVFLLLMALTGGLLAQGERAMAWFYPALYATVSSSSLPPADIYARVASARPDLTMRYLRYPATAGIALIGMGEMAGDPPGSMTHMFAIDPATGAVVGVQSALSNIVIVAAYLHVSLFMGEFGRYIIGIFGIGLLFVVISGFLTWWPGWRSIRWGFRIRRTGKTRVLVHDLHRVAGAVFGIFVAVAALAGTLLAYPDFTSYLLGVDATPHTAMSMEMDTSANNVPHVDMAAAYRVAYEAFPGLQLITAETPMDASGTYRFVFVDNRWRRYTAFVNADHVMLDRVIDPRMAGTPGMVESSLYPLHTGAFFANAGRWLAVSLACMVLFWGFSGLYLYLSRPRKTALWTPSGER